MDLPLTRELARLASVLELLSAQRHALTELSDIKEFRNLESDLSEAIRVARDRGLIPADPVQYVQADWQRLVQWSNRVQECLREIDELGRAPAGISACGSDPSDAHGSGKPTLTQLRNLEEALSSAPQRLDGILLQAREGILQTDWEGHRPYAELTEVAEAMGWRDILELAELPGSWATGVPPRARPFVASRIAVEPGSPSVIRRKAILKERLNGVRTQIRHHTEQAAILSGAARFLEDGDVAGARREIDRGQPMFGDLDFEGLEREVVSMETRLAERAKKVEEEAARLRECITELRLLAQASRRFFVIPPVRLMLRGMDAIHKADVLLAKFSSNPHDDTPTSSNPRIESLVLELRETVEAFRAESVSHLRLAIVKAVGVWLVVAVVVGSGIQAYQVRQERQRQRLAAIAKVAEERAMAEAKAKAEAEELERQRLAAEAKVKAEAQERERQRLEAEARAAEERALADVKAKAEAEELDRKRLEAEARAAEEQARAEAKAKAEAAEEKIASMMGIFRPFAPGTRIQAGIVAARWIPAGRYMMGSPNSDGSRDSDERQHQVDLRRGFFMAETECTQVQWEAVMGKNPAHFKGSQRPVEMVSWQDAVSYCRRLTAEHLSEGILPDGWEWRLPTESEWEYAARAGTIGVRHGDLDSIAWHGGNSSSETHPVKQKGANAWGLRDMMGNVWEWCSDWYGDYAAERITDPDGASSGPGRVIRGGGWASDAQGASSAGRNWGNPDVPLYFLGFRPALSSVR